MPKSVRRITVCPKCGSRNVSFERNPAYVSIGLINQFKECDDCGHHAMIFPTVAASAARKKPKSPASVRGRTFFQTSLGKTYCKYFVLMAIFTMIFAIILFLNKS